MKYEEEHKVRELALAYEQAEDPEILGKLYEALVVLADPLVKSICKDTSQYDFYGDIIHDACTLCVLRLRDGLIDADSGWTMYLFRVLRMRASYDNPLHGAHEQRKRGLASYRIKQCRKQEYPILRDPFAVYLEDILQSVEELSVVENLQVLADRKRELREYLKYLTIVAANIVPYRDSGVIALFLFFSVVSLFDISSEDALFFNSCGLPLRHSFLVNFIRKTFLCGVDCKNGQFKRSRN